MKEKEKMIIEAAIRLFAQKGYSQTSIQQIANECGISKGAFYTYFKSKETLLPAIFIYYSEKMRKKVLSFEKKNIPPKEKLIKQIIVLYESLTENKEFIIMLSRETAIPKNDAVKRLIYKIQLETHQFYQHALLDIYGDQIQPLLWDLAIIIEGMFQAYIRILLFSKDSLNLTDLSTFIVERIDDVVVGLLTKNSKPIISELKMEQLLFNQKIFFDSDQEIAKELVVQLKKELEILDNQDLDISLEVLEMEINNSSPRPAVIQGMLSNFKETHQFDDFCQKITEIYKLK